MSDGEYDDTGQAHSTLLYQNEDKSIFLIDIPSSITAAQGFGPQDNKTSLVSSPEPVIPFASNEPRSDLSKPNLTVSDNDKDCHFQRLVSDAVADVKTSHRGSWCHSRGYERTVLTTAHKRKIEQPKGPTDHDRDVYIQSPQQTTYMRPHQMKDLAACTHIRLDVHSRKRSDIGAEEEVSSLTKDNLGGHYWCNSGAGTAVIDLQTDSFGPWRFRIPPQASYFLSDCNDSRSFHAQVRRCAQEEGTKSQFDLIVMDPPWPNASVKRARKTGASSYQTADTLPDLTSMLIDMDIAALLAPNGVIAVWITNKPAVHDMILGEDGLFAGWGVVLEEEWIWIKVTKHGEPVTALDATWRKPYEVLLVGRKRGMGQSADLSVAGNVRRRVIAGVPDLHSRKPCLKELLESLVIDRQPYRGLEVFARHLISGWWSWGNEVLKFNHESHWRKQSQRG